MYLQNRENKIKEDLENANKFKEESEAKLKEYDLILENAKKEVLKIHFESKSTLDKDIQSKKEVIEKEIEKEILKAGNLAEKNFRGAEKYFRSKRSKKIDSYIPTPLYSEGKKIYLSLLNQIIS